MGFASLSVLEASGAVPEVTVTGQYRGATLETHLRPKARLECVVGADHASIVVDTVVKHGGERYFVSVLAVEQAQPTETVKLDEAAAAPAG